MEEDSSESIMPPLSPHPQAPVGFHYVITRNFLVITPTPKGQVAHGQASLHLVVALGS